jgi:hypothetical protein
MRFLPIATIARKEPEGQGHKKTEREEVPDPPRKAERAQATVPPYPVVVPQKEEKKKGDDPLPGSLLLFVALFRGLSLGLGEKAHPTTNPSPTRIEAIAPPAVARLQ